MPAALLAVTMVYVDVTICSTIALFLVLYPMLIIEDEGCCTLEPY